MRLVARGGLLVAWVVALAAVPALGADYEQGLDYFKAGKYAEAAQEFQALVDDSPSYDYGYYMLGLSFLKMQKLDDAERNLRKAIEIDPDKFEYHHGLASLLTARNRYGEAARALGPAEGLATEPASKYALYSLRGSARASARDWGGAVEDLEKARAIKKTSALLVQLGKAYYALEHNDKAVPLLREAAAQNPSDAETLELLSEACIKAAKEERDPQQKKKYYAEAVQAAEKYRSLVPGSAEGANLVGKAALGAQDFARAEQSFRRVLELKPDHCYAMINLGKTYIAMEKYEAAERPLKDAALCAPRQAAVYESLGLVYQKYAGRDQAGTPEKAFAEYDQALKYYQQASSIKSSPFVAQAIDTIHKNVEILRQNVDLQKAQEAAQEAERKRIEEEERKRKEWEERRRRGE